MAVKWKSRAARMGEEMEEAGRAVLRSRVLTRAAECAMRFLLGAVLASGEVLGEFAPFGIGMVACSGSGTDGLCALVGAVWGYLVFRGFTEGLRYAAACVLVFSVAFAFCDIKLYRKGWFMPLIAGGMDAITGFVYLADSAWRPAKVIFFCTEVLLAGASAYFYRLAFSPWSAKGETELTARQRISVLFLLGTLLVSMGGLTFLGGLSLGRLLSILTVLAVAHTGGLGYGAAAGVALGLGMDLAAGEAPFYAVAYGFSGLLVGAGWRQGRLFGALSYVVSNAAVVLWAWDQSPRISGLYEAFMASVLFLLLPQGWLRQLRQALSREEAGKGARRAAEYVEKSLSATAEAFRQLRDHLRAAFPEAAPNDADPSAIFDRAAQQVCRKCALRGSCWEQNYVSTYNALNDALPAMMERGKGEAGDFPGWFASRCIQFPAFLQAANEELTALRYRRQYQSRLRESRGAVYRQYETLADILTAASAELSAELTPDPVREKRLRQHLAALDLEGETAVYYDSRGRLRLEVRGRGVEALGTPQELERLSRRMGLPLRRGEEERGKLVLLQAEPLMAVAGVAARRREGQQESGDTGTWFKREDGSLFVLLCDGMGSGQAAHRESALAVRLLEEFLRSGMESAAALRTVNSALALRNEGTGAFTTVDLLRLDLYTGEGELCKLGAAPTYLRRGNQVSRVAGTALPAGLAGNGSPDVTRLELEAGDCVLLVSDGIADAGDDQWARRLLAEFDGKSPKELAGAVMAESEKRVGAADDRTAVVISLRKREPFPQREAGAEEKEATAP